MEEIVLSQHAQSPTKGIAAFGDDLRQAGHTVHTPDLFDGRTFDDFEQGMRFVNELGYGEIMRRAVISKGDYHRESC